MENHYEPSRMGVIMEIISIYDNIKSIPDVQQLMTEYLKIEYKEATQNDLQAIEKFKHEIADLPGDYVPPDGLLLLALESQKPAGCAALKKLNRDICEMKRLYVKPDSRGMGIGKKLSLALIHKAQEAGYSKMRLDTTPSMKQAIQLYRSLGFKEIKKYREVPTSCSIFMELEL